jgi:flagella basal body P-ring formation protein FlgA
MAQATRPVISTMRDWLAPVARVLVGAAALIAVLPGSACLADQLVMPVPRITIYPGNVITESMLTDKLIRGPDAGGPSYASAREELIGKVARQTLLPDLPVSTAGLREPFAVKQGQAAVVIFQSGGLIISATAIPLQAGSAGEVISLRNIDSGTTIRGIVQGDGTVRVGTP